jgi:hypothetical protein
MVSFAPFRRSVRKYNDVSAELARGAALICARLNLSRHARPWSPAPVDRSRLLAFLGKPMQMTLKRDEPLFRFAFLLEQSYPKTGIHPGSSPGQAFFGIML